MKYESHFFLKDPYDWFCGPGSHICLLWQTNETSAVCYLQVVRGVRSPRAVLGMDQQSVGAHQTVSEWHGGAVEAGDGSLVV